MTKLSEVPIRRLLWLLPLAFALHELEEWNILDWYRQYWTNVDAELMTQRTVRTHLVWSSVLGFLWTVIATRFKRSTVTLHIVLVYFTRLRLAGDSTASGGGEPPGQSVVAPAAAW